jgi:thiol-disulfide isomerase/thioredoxin
MLASASQFHFMRILIYFSLFFFVRCGVDNNNAELVVSGASTQSTVKITVQVKNHTPEYRLKLFEPIDGNYNYTYLPIQNSIAFSKDTTVQFIGMATKPGCYIVQYESYRAILNLFPGDSVAIAIDEKDKPDTYNISGSNASIHTSYNKHEYQLFYGEGFDTVLVPSLSDPENIDRINKFIAGKTTYIDSAIQGGLVEKDKAEYFRKVHAISIWGNFQDEIANLYGQKGAKGRTLFSTFYEKFSPFDSNLTKAFIGDIYTCKYLTDVNRDYTTQVGNLQVDSNFHRLSIKQPSYDYSTLPERFQDVLYGHLILDDLLSPYPDFDRSLVYPYYKQKFPNSAYIPIIDSLEELSKLEAKNKRQPSFINFDGKLKQLHDTYFKDKPVFIDLWATWCVPCIQEFQYKKGLDSFLHKNKVEMLYISMDEPIDSLKWKRVVNRSALGGNHIIAGNQLRADLVKNLFKTNQWAIPRYVLLDHEGNVIVSDAKRPSSENSLYNQILDELPIVL